MKRILTQTAIVFSLVGLMTACGHGGGGGGGTPPPSTSSTTISGKVTLSSTVAKPALVARSAPYGRPGSKLYQSTLPAAGVNQTLLATATPTPLDGATVDLYDADHPEWLAPVAETTADSSGNYTFTSLTNAAKNNSAYTDGDPIPAGKYTLVAYKFSLGQKPLVATQTIVNQYTGAVTGQDLVAQPSDAAPTVRTMFGYAKNTDGTQTWGNSGVTLPTNAAIQISFSMAMWRDNLSSIIISPAVSGHWTLSPDWTTATFYPDSGVTLAPNTTYTVTVTGNDQATVAVPAVTNVYGNPIALTAVGTFTTTSGADTLPPTGVWSSPTVAQMASPVDVTTPIRIGSNKVLDVNSLLLEGTPSLGAKPGVIFVGKDAAGLYIYEFNLGHPLQLGTTYTLKVSGGKDLAGNVMNDLTGSLTTVSAGLSSGISATADTATQNAQASVKDVFGKWIRGLNDRNLTEMQGVMSGNFYMEYDVASQGIDNQSDVNRDGRYSMKEFSNMLSTNAFPMWQYCGTTISGSIVGIINVVGSEADFEFKLSASSTVTSQQCADAAPRESLYATLQNINGAWTIVRASDGIDTRTRPIVNPAKITLSLTENGNSIANGGQLSTAATSSVSPSTVTFSWGAVSNVATYVVILVDARNPQQGMAFAVPSTITSLSTNVDPISLGAKDVSALFGFGNQDNGGSSGGSTTGGSGGGGNGPFVPGGQYYWEVIGLGSIGMNSVDTSKISDVIADIIAISDVDNFSIAGTYKELTATVTPSGSSTPLTYNEQFRGYDAGSAGTVAIAVHTMNPDSVTNANACASLNVNGSSSQSYPLTFTNGNATVNAQLFQGWNDIWISDCAGLNKDFSIQTTGGIPPVITLSSVVDDQGRTLQSDNQFDHYYNGQNSTGFVSGSKKVTITGLVSAGVGTIQSLNVNVWNDSLQANFYAQAPVTYDANGGHVTATVEIYKGDNWINIDGNTTGGSWYSANLGVYTDTGSIYVPPFANVRVWSSSTTTLAPKNNYGNSADYDASTVASNSVTITGKLKNPNDGTYWINSDGSNSSGTLKVQTDGSFSLTVALYNGWNNIGMNDANGNWYGVNIYTSAGLPVYKMTISTINGATYTPPTTGGMGTATASQCYATIAGQAIVGQVQVNWSGYDGVNSYNEWQSVQSTGTGTLGTFSVTVPLVSGAGSYNNIDLNDANWKWMGMSITTTGNCPYTAPTVTVTSVVDASSTPLTQDTYGNYTAGASQTITINGTTNRPGLTVNAFMGACGLNQNYSGTASTTPNGSGTYNWTISNVAVYDTTNTGSDWININSGNGMSFGFGVTSTNGVQPVPPIQIISVSYSGGTLSPGSTAGCGFAQYDATAAGTGITQVTISGHSDAGAGTGNYMDSTGQNHQFTIDSSGNFTLTNIAVYNGDNNFNINDANWNYTGVDITTANGIQKPQFVFVTSPANAATGITGVQTVTGNLATSSGFAPTRVYASASLYDTVTGSSSYINYSSDPQDQSSLGDSPLTFDGTNFSFNVNFGTGMQAYISVWANDDVTYASHGISIDVNDPNAGPAYYYKPGAPRTSGPSSRKAYEEQQALKRMLSTGSRGR